jgi:ElaB/YqjD/DUF883 family membrane-anchored ribosome-binding protein
MEDVNRMENEAKKTSAKLEAVIEKAKDTYGRLQDQTVAAAKATHQTIQEKPYHAMGVAFGVGVLVGVLVMWSRRD